MKHSGRRIALSRFSHSTKFACAAAAAVLVACMETAAPTRSGGAGKNELAMAFATVPASFTDAQVVAGLSQPTLMAIAPDGRIFVSQQAGQVKVIKNGTLLATPFVSLNVNSDGERGALGIAFDPAFASNQYVYIYYTSSSGPHNRVSRFTANGDVGSGETILLDLPTLSGATNHNGGAIHFGSDGKLYVAVGENANGGLSQNLNSPMGKMLRINPDGSIPTDNPFYGQTSGINRAIWALGLRNPFTFAVQPGTGRQFINDVGQSTWEEIDENSKGANFGWPGTEGDGANPSFKNPYYAYIHNNGVCAITGGDFYNPSSSGFPQDYVGDYFFADYCAGWIKRIDLNTKAVTDFASGISSPTDIKTGNDGSLYYIARGSGSIRKITYTTSQAPAITQHPANKTVSVGGSATFTVAASGAAPLAYQWQRNQADISGATGTSYTVANAQAGDNAAKFRARVTNSAGSAVSNEATLTVTTNQAPVADISSPAAGATFQGGQAISFAGTGVDPQDGNLPASSLTWEIKLFHNDGSQHSHPAYGPATGSSGVFTIPAQGETSPNIWYRFYLTAKDAQGMTSIDSTDVQPIKANVTLAANQPGLQLRLDGSPVTAPHTFTSVVGMKRVIEAVSPQTFQGSAWTFASWSDGGLKSHEITTPASATTLTATFQGGTTPPLVLEAESALLSGAIKASNHAGFTGTGFVDYINASNDYIEWTVNMPAAGSKTLDFRYGLVSGTRNLRITVNGAIVNSSLAFPTSGAWTTWRLVSIPATLNAGANKVRATAIGSSGPNVDNLTVR